MSASDEHDPTRTPPDAMAQTVASERPSATPGRSPTGQVLHDNVHGALFGERPAEHDYEAGTVLAGRYRIVGWLGEGGMGRVYRARDLVLDAEVAIKFLPRRYADRPEYLARFVREVRVARQVSHPNVCRVHDIGNLDGQPFLSMEYIDGEDLGALLLRIGQLGRDKAIDLAHELCAGLEALHELGLVHRDLKPSNVMIDGRGRARITDFGLAAPDRELSDAELRDGTPAYQAPEQAAGREVSPRTDVYALGAILFEMFSGQSWLDLPAAAAERPAEVQARLIAVDSAVAEAVARAVDPDPERRPRGALELAAALPGGDPLVAAVAAGRMPSPEMVANARTVGGLAPRLALGLAVVAAVLLLVLNILQARALVLDHNALPPAILEHQAKARLVALGTTKSPMPGASFVTFDHAALARAQEASSESGSATDRLRSDHFSPVRLVHRRYVDLGALAGPKLDTNDPPLTREGDALLELDINGKLVRFVTVPGEHPADGDADPDPSIDSAALGEPSPDAIAWDELLTSSGFDPASSQVARPRALPPVYADQRRAWTVVANEIPFRIEAAAFRDKLVWWTAEPERDEERLAEVSPFGITVDKRTTPVTGTFALTIFAAFGVLMAVLAVLLVINAVRTLRRHEADHLGARRLGVTVAVVELAVLFLTARSPPDVLGPGLARAFGSGAVMWLGYLMIEPYARRNLPRCLIGWTRVLQGRLRDPQVGREVFLGVVCAIAASCGLAACSSGPTPLTQMFAASTLMGPRFALGDTLAGTLSGAFAGVSFVLVLALVSGVARRRWLARVLVVGGLALFAGMLATVYGVADGVGWAVWTVLEAAFLIWVGLLGTAVLGASATLLALYPADPTFSHWWASSAAVPLFTLCGLAAFGFWVATSPSRRRSRANATR